MANVYSNVSEELFDAVAKFAKNDIQKLIDNGADLHYTRAVGSGLHNYDYETPLLLLIKTIIQNRSTNSRAWTISEPERCPFHIEQARFATVDTREWTDVLDNIMKMDSDSNPLFPKKYEHFSNGPDFISDRKCTLVYKMCLDSIYESISSQPYLKYAGQTNAFKLWDYLITKMHSEECADDSESVSPSAQPNKMYEFLKRINDKKITDKYGQSAVHFTHTYDEYRLMKQHKINFDVKDFMGRSKIHWISINSCEDDELRLYRYNDITHFSSHIKLHNFNLQSDKARDECHKQFSQSREGDINGMTPLHFLIYNGQELFVYSSKEDMIPADTLAAINDPDRLGLTPLHHAARGSRAHKKVYWTSTGVETVEVSGKQICTICKLLMAGSDPGKTDKYGKTALDYAKQNNRQHVTRFLEELPMNSSDEVQLRHMCRTAIYSIQTYESDIDKTKTLCYLKFPAYPKRTIFGIRDLLSQPGVGLLSNNPLKERVTVQLRKLVDRIGKKLSQLDERFAVNVELGGSVEEGTKIGCPDECDFLFYMAKLEGSANVVFKYDHSDEIASVRIKTRSNDFSYVCQKAEEIHPTMLSDHFNYVVNKALSDKEIWDDLDFYWDELFNSGSGIQLTWMGDDNWHGIGVKADIHAAINFSGTLWPSDMDPPKNKLVSDITKYGFCVVLKETRWRMSSCKAEHELVKALPSGARLGYKICKIFYDERDHISAKNVVIHESDSLTDYEEEHLLHTRSKPAKGHDNSQAASKLSLTSYMLKTALFHVSDDMMKSHSACLSDASVVYRPATELNDAEVQCGIDWAIRIMNYVVNATLHVPYQRAYVFPKLEELQYKADLKYAKMVIDYLNDQQKQLSK